MTKCPVFFDLTRFRLGVFDFSRRFFVSLAERIDRLEDIRINGQKLNRLLYSISRSIRQGKF